ncbi:TRAP transporter solute receptor, TAXI family protein [Candidatus Endolissoclinum faulkneri L2]|uniref:TRAP transporter solute receptor, TAXI family protein n=1 Tax=Candidatus Endolissoclinum faulkneri L2 TaxID=1193729 RepID=K7YN86_9PROT|nr:TRAP transporter solute receptor, TAXI family protein [Candidatus Endolissoclinum faulkneri L2]
MEASTILTINFSSASAQKQQFISIGTGGVTGVYYPTGGAICRLINRDRKKHGIRCSVESTGGSIYNANTIHSDELEFGIVQSDVQYDAYNGTGTFGNVGPFRELRSVFSLHAEPVTIVARKNANIRTFDDLKGTRVNIGNAGSGTRNTWEIIEQALGWKRNNLKLAAELKASETAEALCDNKIDANFSMVGHPAAIISETMSTCEANLVSITGPAFDKLVADHPYYRKATIPGGLYPGSSNDIDTFGVGATLMTSSKVSDEVVYTLTKAVFGNLEDFKKLHPAFANLKAEEMIKEALSAPLHPGAIKAYKELGLM